MNKIFFAAANWFVGCILEESIKKIKENPYEENFADSILGLFVLDVIFFVLLFCNPIDEITYGYYVLVALISFVLFFSVTFDTIGKKAFGLLSILNNLILASIWPIRMAAMIVVGEYAILRTISLAAFITAAIPLVLLSVVVCCWVFL